MDDEGRPRGGRFLASAQVFAGLLAAAAGAEGCGSGTCGPNAVLVEGLCVLQAATPPDACEGRIEGGNAVPIDSYPPVVVATVPANGDLAVDPSLARIEVSFSRPMRGESWSWVAWEGFGFPAMPSAPAFTSPTDHAAEEIGLEAEEGYLVWFNGPEGEEQGFVGEDGAPAMPYPLAFHTGDGADVAVLADAPPAVIATVPAPGAVEVDPATERIAVTFSKDMYTGSFGWAPDAPETYPAVVGEAFVDARTAVLGVCLAPATTYAIRINDPTPGFIDAGGVPAAPYIATFRTAEAAP